MTSFKLRRTEKSAQYLCAINDLTHHEFCDGNLCCSEISIIPIEIEKVPKLLPSQTGEGAKGGWGDAEPPQTKTVSLLPGWEKVPKADEGGTGTKNIDRFRIKCGMRKKLIYSHPIQGGK